ncbi:hypothetical protein F4824DRAFT_495331 [Ustulina deusta]|nr:hypothetical protein F4824DRAFT_495331 [Ustulina deusta]
MGDGSLIVLPRLQETVNVISAQKTHIPHISPLVLAVETAMVNCTKYLHARRVAPQQLVTTYSHSVLIFSPGASRNMAFRPKQFTNYQAEHLAELQGDVNELRVLF